LAIFIVSQKAKASGSRSNQDIKRIPLISIIPPTDPRKKIWTNSVKGSNALRLTPISTEARMPISITEGVQGTMKEYECVQVNHHKEIAKVVKEYLTNGWHLHTYQATGYGAMVSHYLLFERG
jgi:hypothetical protein